MSDFSDKWLVETEWLQRHLDAPDLVVLDASWHMPNLKRSAHQDYLEEHIPGAMFFDIDEIADTSCDLPHMLPSPVKFSSRMRKMGIGDGMRIVVYDSYGILSAPRVWWTFRTMGVADVAVLNGGLKKWKVENRPLEDLASRPRSERHFTARLNREMISAKDNIAQSIKTPTAQIVDARSQGRFKALEPEPRPNLKGGHMPGAVNLPCNILLNDDGTLKPANELKAAIEAAGINLQKPIISTCGSGITAAILSLALAILGHKHNSLYDGSWAEWGADDNVPIETT